MGSKAVKPVLVKNITIEGISQQSVLVITYHILYLVKILIELLVWLAYGLRVYGTGINVLGIIQV